MNTVRPRLTEFFKHDGIELRFFLILSVIFGLIFLIFIPPMQGPDEPNHFLRVTQLAEGNLLSDEVANSTGGFMPVLKTFDKNVGGMVPDGFLKLAHYRYDDFHGATDRSYSPFDIAIMKDIRNTGERVPAAFGNTAAYSPVAYIPSLISVWIGNLFHATPLVLFYLARLGGLIAGIALLALAIRITPIGKLPMAIIALLPMTIAQISTISADTMTIGLSFLALAFTLKLSLSKQFPSKWQVVGLLALFTFVGLAKPSLLPLALLALFLLLNPAIRAQKYKILPIVTAAVTIIPALIWNNIVKAASEIGYAGSYPGSSYVGNVEFLKHNFLEIPSIVFQSFFNTSFQVRIPTGFIGNVGWQDTPLLSTFVIVGYIILFLAIFVSTTGKYVLPVWAKILSFCIGAGIILVSLASMYLLTAVPGSPFVDGLQGRYFLPAAPFFALAFIRTKPVMKPEFTKVVGRRILITTSLLLIVMTILIIQRYWIEGYSI